MLFIIIILPLFGAIFSGLIGRYVGRQGSVFLSLFCMIFVSLICWYHFINLCIYNTVYFLTFSPWIYSNCFLVNWGFLFDSVTLLMLTMISNVSTVVHIYSTGYMSDDPHLNRFISYLSFFTFFMFVLISADNFIQLFLGWEGVGMCSYLLINFWFTRVQANKSALKALIMNRIGDFGLLLGILMIFYYFRTVDFATIFILIPYFVGVTIKILNYEFNLLFFISLFLFLGSIGKSAQLGLHTWLADAMEGPTPVSALIHAATMVTAGVFLIIRCSYLFEYSVDSLLIIGIVGSLTCFFSSTIGIVQNDIKKIIAFSTCSQLGYMIFSCGLSSYHISFFHLINHAFFKALLFLTSGIIIHAFNNEQDMRKMGGVLKLLPCSYSFMLIGSLALTGFPFLSGFYSKDIILETSYTKYKLIGLFSYFLGTLSAFFTSFYSIRLLLLTFFVKSNSFRYNLIKIHEGNKKLSLFLLLLVIGSIYSGYLLKDLFIGFGCGFFNNSINILARNSISFELEFLPLYIKILPTFFSLMGFFIAFYSYNFLFYKLPKTSFLLIYWFLSKKWFIDHIYNKYIGLVIFQTSYQVYYKRIDKGFLELFGPTLLSRLIYKLAQYSLQFQTGMIYHYVCFLCLNLFLFFIFFEVRYI